MTETAPFERGRHSVDRQSWSDVYAQLTAADHRMPLEPEDLERLAMVAYLVGRSADSLGFWARAHHGRDEVLEAGVRAALSASH